jgi:hypothetical protein
MYDFRELDRAFWQDDYGLQMLSLSLLVLLSQFELPIDLFVGAGQRACIC